MRRSFSGTVAKMSMFFLTILVIRTRLERPEQTLDRGFLGDNEAVYLTSAKFEVRLVKATESPTKVVIASAKSCYGKLRF